MFGQKLVLVKTKNLGSENSLNQNFFGSKIFFFVRLKNLFVVPLNLKIDRGSAGSG